MNKGKAYFFLLCLKVRIGENVETFLPRHSRHASFVTAPSFPRCPVIMALQMNLNNNEDDDSSSMEVTLRLSAHALCQSCFHREKRLVIIIGDQLLMGREDLVFRLFRQVSYLPGAQAKIVMRNLPILVESSVCHLLLIFQVDRNEVTSPGVIRRHFKGLG